MGIYNNGIYSAFDYYYLRPDSDDFFKLSDINSKFMKKHNISGTVINFKSIVRKSKPFTRVYTGNYKYNYRSTPIYNIKDFKK